MQIELTVNGAKRSLEVDGKRSLLEVLREDLGLTGTKYGCGEGDCRACAVLVDGVDGVGGKAVPSCQLTIAAMKDRDVKTIEGLAAGGELHPVQQAFVKAGAMQCGYCVPGMILTASALLAKNPHPSDAEIVDAMDGNICRCAGYVNILEAVRIASGRKETRL